MIERNPLDGFRGPARSGVRLHAPVTAVRDLIALAQADVEGARTARTGDTCPPSDLKSDPKSELRLHRAEQVLLLVRLAADTGARRGELATLKFDDLDGDVLTIARGASCEIIGPTMSGRIRRLTLGATVAALWRDTAAVWQARATPVPLGPWLFSARTDHTVRLTTGCAGHWFTDLADRAGHPDVTLHRLRHTVATVLVGQGDILQAQQRLGHRDASTTLRMYSHAVPLTDADAAERLDALYR